MIYTALNSVTEKPEVYDVFVIPDYDTLLRDCLDPIFGRCFKDIWTQHCFMFEKGKFRTEI